MSSTGSKCSRWRVNSIWGIVPGPPNRNKIREKRQMQSICFFTSVTKILSDNFQNNFRNLISSGGLLRDIIWVVYKNPWLSRFFKNISASFWYFFVKSFLVARSYPFLVININILIIGALGTLETRLKVPILAIFWRFWAFFELSV